MSKTYKLDEGKYTIVYEGSCDNIKEILRYNNPWKGPEHIAGDNVLYLLFSRILELEEQLLNIELDKDK